MFGHLKQNGSFVPLTTDLLPGRLPLANRSGFDTVSPRIHLAGSLGVNHVMAKRCFDIVASALGLLLISPLLLVVAAAIWVTDGLPVLFRQRRVGWRGRTFCLYKFRTMRVAERTELGSFHAGDSSRVTRLGRLLRKTKVDELPQLWNVLRGDMSLVGPRPEVEKWTAVYPRRWEVVHQMRPGITDPASVEFRDEEELLATSPDPDAL